MIGLMMHAPLLLSDFLEHAAHAHATTEIVTREFDGSIHRYTYNEANSRAKKLAKALAGRGIREGNRIGTLAWNTFRHFEIFYGVSGSRAILHTVNPRLFHKQIVYIINHAEDDWLFFDLETLPLVEDIACDLTTVKQYCLMSGPDQVPDNVKLPGLVCYEELLAEQNDDYNWPALNENSASSICYTSGTTGNPKGVVYSHRAMVLATLTLGLRDFLGYTRNGHLDVACALAPMFHGNAWNFPYLAPMLGMKLVLPGRDYSDKAIIELLQKERVTLACGVPTLWLLIFEYLEKNDVALPSLKTALSAGNTPPDWLIEKMRHKYGIELLNTWGGTECLVASTGSLKPGHDALSEEKQLELLRRSGRPHWGVQLRIVDDNNNLLPHDGKSAGHLQAKGHFVASGYYKLDEASAITKDSWFNTGDVAIIDEHRYFQIIDRSKDVIKSGGEWISSVEIENQAILHPGIIQAAVIAIAHKKWQERPLLICVRENEDVTEQEILEFLSKRIAKWWIPDSVEFFESIPVTTTGKIIKAKLRETLKELGYNLP